MTVNYADLDKDELQEILNEKLEELRGIIYGTPDEDHGKKLIDEIETIINYESL